MRRSVRRRAISSGEMFASMKSIYEGARPLRPLALALKILSTMLRSLASRSALTQRRNPATGAPFRAVGAGRL
jgi:hypothetical protein